MQCWIKLLENFGNIRGLAREACAGSPVDAEIHLGRLMYVTVSSRYKDVQVRQYALPAKGSQMFATKGGVGMGFQEYFYFLKMAEEFTDRIHLASTLIPCYRRVNHSASCLKCFPTKFWKNKSYEIMDF